MAKRKAREARLSPDAVYARLQRSQFLDLKFVARLRAGRKRWIPVLKRSLEPAQGLSKDARMRAGFLLLQLGEPSGTIALLAGLEDSDYETWANLFSALSTHALFSWPLALDAQGFAPVLASCLEEPDSRLGRMAIEIASAYALPRMLPRLRELLDHASLEVRAMSCSRLLRAGQGTSRVLDCAESILLDAAPIDVHRQRHEQGILVLGLIQAAQSSKRSVATRAVTLLDRFVRAHIATEDNSTANDIWRALDAVVEARGARALPLVEAVLESSTLDWVRGMGLRHLAGLRGPDSLPRLLASLEDEALRQDAAEALVALARHHDISSAFGEVLAAAEGETRTSVVQSIVKAIVATQNSKARGVLRSLVATLDPVAAMQAQWFLKRIQPDRLIARLVKTKIVPEPSKRKLTRIMRTWKESQDPYKVVMAVFHSSKRWLTFDVEAGALPVRHDELLLDFAQATRGALKPDKVVQKWNRTDQRDLKADYAVRFSHGGKVYRFKARNRGDWYDVRAVVDCVHRALRDVGCSERFLSFHTGDQTACFVFADEKSMRSVADEFFIPMDDDF